MCKKDWRQLQAYKATGLTPEEIEVLKEELEWAQAAMAAGIRAAGQDKLCGVIPPGNIGCEANSDCSKCYGQLCSCKECDGGSCFVWIGPEENNA